MDSSTLLSGKPFGGCVFLVRNSLLPQITQLNSKSESRFVLSQFVRILSESLHYSFSVDFDKLVSFMSEMNLCAADTK